MYFKGYYKKKTKKEYKYKIILISLTIFSLISISFNIRLINEVNYYRNLSSVEESQKLIQENSYLKNEVTFLSNEVANLQKRIEQINQTYNAQISQLQEEIKNKDIQINNLQQQIIFYQSQLQKAQLTVITVYGEIKSLKKVKVNKIEFENGDQKFTVNVKDSSYKIKLINSEIYNIKVYYDEIIFEIFFWSYSQPKEHTIENWMLNSNEANYKFDIYISS